MKKQKNVKENVLKAINTENYRHRAEVYYIALQAHKEDANNFHKMARVTKDHNGQYISECPFCNEKLIENENLCVYFAYEDGVIRHDR